MTKAKRKRVEWSGSPRGTCWRAEVGHWTVWLFRHGYVKGWRVQARYGGSAMLDGEFDAKSLTAAKAEALRIVQRAVLAAADEWRD